MTNKLIIINSDDYGRTPEISRGILYAWNCGVVRSTTVLSNVVTEDEVQGLVDLSLPAGLHFNLTYGQPLSFWSSVFLDSRGCFARRNPEDLPLGCIEDELEAQWDFLVSRSIEPTHIDSHHHIHAYAPVLAVVSAFALKRGVPVRTCDDAVRQHLKRMNISTTDGFSREFYGGENLSVDRFFEIVDGSNFETFEIMCHVGYNTVALSTTSTYSSEREIELKVLTDERILNGLRLRGVTLGNFRDL